MATMNQNMPLEELPTEVKYLHYYQSSMNQPSAVPTMKIEFPADTPTEVKWNHMYNMQYGLAAPPTVSHATLTVPVGTSTYLVGPCSPGHSPLNVPAGSPRFAVGNMSPMMMSPTHIPPSAPSFTDPAPVAVAPSLSAPVTVSAPSYQSGSASPVFMSPPRRPIGGYTYTP
uniref:Uncharacterized protein n=1 Tax=Eutreptiella gymnastica TaxID=73025 RepID=A0A7S4FSS5_9EUGL|eukprot:CAMPEP_0174285258 /NCGR_PEP_ID=MMETSP0809-20121228/8124_1 /TAXON_ID=73025 ORGANISM="Eutreptiella gymnastica-like, Strain CCMP1594" /NCGR_SAMPLE_ID=MMETSP0809 /ASSEMBLY_ACC=CAM_ASM_000658 /LENGTH=170 /DNA_ID=CAMNT_0015380971 /DNA_START=40 /DNA_END=552 /DNA_ORIENTATION=+